MQYQIENYMVLPADGKTESGIRHRKAAWEVTVTGARIYPIDVPIPFIVNGQGCYGYATVREFTVSSNSTTVKFVFSPIDDKSVKNALYNLYRNAITASGSDDYEDESDAIIPGMGTRGGKSNFGNTRPSPRGWSGWSSDDDDRRPLSSFSDD